MRGIAWVLLALGPLIAAPAAAGLWTRAHFAGAHGADFYGVAAAGGVLVIEGLLLSLRGLVRELSVFALSAFWAGWTWLGLTQPGYAWTAPPIWRAPDPRGWMVIIAAMLLALAIYGLADGGRRRGRLS
jgi:hypothetical protein